MAKQETPKMERNEGGAVGATRGGGGGGKTHTAAAAAENENPPREIHLLPPHHSTLLPLPPLSPFSLSPEIKNPPVEATTFGYRGTEGGLVNSFLSTKGGRDEGSAAIIIIALF